MGIFFPVLITKSREDSLMSVKVNGIEISEKEIESSVESVKQHYAKAPQQPPEDEMRRMAVDHLIDQVLIKEISDNDESDPTIDELHDFYLSNQAQGLMQLPREKAREEVVSRIRFGRVVSNVVNKVEPVTTEESKIFYDANPKAFIQPERVHAAHILKQVDGGDETSARESIDALKARVDAGERFEELAKTESDCQENNGDLGTFPRGHMVEEFENVVFSMKEGEVSDSFLSPFGFHIVKLYKHIDSDKVPFDDICDRLTEDLTNRRRHAAMQSFVTELRKQATIVMT